MLRYNDSFVDAKASRNALLAYRLSNRSDFGVGH